MRVEANGGSAAADLCLPTEDDGPGAASRTPSVGELLSSASGDGPELPVLAPVEVAELERVVNASLAPSSRAAYTSDWSRFSGWASERGHPHLPAPPLVVALYLTVAAAEQVSEDEFRYAPSTMARWVASINQVHRAAGFSAPGRSELVRRTLSGIRRTRATPPVRRTPLLLEDIRSVVEGLTRSATAWPAGVAARRDACLLLMGFAGAFRRSELAALTIGDVVLHRRDGLHVRLRSSKTDQEAAGRVVALPYGRYAATCPPCAWLRWYELVQAADAAGPGAQRRAVMRVLRRQADEEVLPDAGRDPGELALLSTPHVCRIVDLTEPAGPGRPLLRPVRRGGRIGERGLTGHAINEIVRRRAGDAGFTADEILSIGGHSLRSGFVTQAFLSGAEAHSIMRQTGHRSHAVLEGYARENAPLLGNAVTRIGL